MRNWRWSRYCHVGVTIINRMQTYLYSSLYSLFLFRLLFLSFSLYTPFSFYSAVSFSSLTPSSPSQTLDHTPWFLFISSAELSLQFPFPNLSNRIGEFSIPTTPSGEFSILRHGSSSSFLHQPGLHRCNRGCHGQGPRRVRQQRWSWRGSSQGASSCNNNNSDYYFFMFIWICVDLVSMKFSISVCWFVWLIFLGLDQRERSIVFVDNLCRCGNQRWSKLV